MTYLSYKQLAFILDIKPIEALEKIIAIHCRVKGINVPAAQERVTDYLHNKDTKGKNVRNSLPETLEVEILEQHLGISLAPAIKDIKYNYLTRPATKKWILCDYPENVIRLAVSNGKKPALSIPPALKSLLLPAVAEEIARQWTDRYPKAVVKV